MNTTHTTPLLAALEQLAPHDHLCSIYESAEEHFAVAIPFIRIGLDRGEKCIYIADDGTEPVVRDAMHAGGIDVERAIATDRLVLETKEAAYLKNGSFDPDWMFTFWADATTEAISQGFPALRATAETEWVLRGAPGLERWTEYESRLTHVLAHHNCVALCQYNRRLFPPELVLDVIRTHPTVIYRGVVCRNMYYVPPDELLGSNQAAREVERLLTNIREREEVEYTLRQQRNELRASEARFREIAENIREVFWVLDLVADRVTFVSPMYEELFGRSCASLYANSRSYLDAIHRDDRARVEAALLRSRGPGAPFDERYRVVRPDGSMRWIRARSFPVPDPTGTIKRLVGVAEDITDRQHAEEGLQQSERLLRLVLDALPVGVAVMDRAGDIILSNPASQRIWSGSIGTGRERYAESKGWWHATGKRLAPQEWASVRAYVNGETAVNEVLDIEAFDGVRKIIQNSAVPIRGADGRITGAVVVNEDISARTTAERDLSDSYNQMRALTGRLMRAQDDERRRIAQLLHETTAQDLAAVKMHLARLNRTASHLSDTDRAALTESISLAEQSITAIRTLSYLLYPPFLDEAGLLSALRWYAAGFAERSGIKVDLELPASFERLPLDTETALFRIVQESLINIHRHAGSSTARIRLQRDAEALVLEIEDRGRGIPNASLKHIMSGGRGVGVGIAGMSERIEQLGGRLEINSSDQGTTVRTRLPLVQHVA
ncbi:MAG TPA: MEDS domain-containing protein [Gemmatimonadales bacterium]|nr:MEDS domain-containing protein [Gemmatimonadales bacterium]